MGDTPIQHVASAEFPHQDTLAGALQTASTIVTSELTGNYSPALSPLHLQQQKQQQHGAPQHAFSSQLSVAQQNGPSRAVPFGMSAMSNALPPSGYRPGPYSHGQPRYNAIAVPSPVSQYGTQSAMAQGPGHQYYVPQHGHMAHFYATPLSPQGQASVPSRADLNYYPNPTAVITQQPHSGTQFYYPQAAHFQGQASQAQGPLVLGPYANLSPQSVNSRQPQPQLSQVAHRTSDAATRMGHAKG